MKVAALGRTHWLYDSITAVSENGHEIVLIGTAEAAADYRVGVEDFVQLARQLGVPYFTGCHIGHDDVVPLVDSTKADVAISVNWPTLINAEVLDLFPQGVINAHAGDLPRYRGNAAPNWAILQGESHIAITLFLMNAELDAGDVLLKRTHALSDSTHIGELYRFMDDNIPGMFVDVLNRLQAGNITPHPQTSEEASALRCFPRRPSDSLIDWTRSATEIDRLIRASSKPFDGAYTYLDGVRLAIWRAHVERLSCSCVGIPGQVATIRRPEGHVVVLTGSGLLVLEEIESAEYGHCKPANMIKSTRKRLGAANPDEIELLRRRLADLEENFKDVSSKRSS